jgi:hypothetical protein
MKTTTEPSQAIATTLKTGYCLYGIGRQQHGLNGKDADLDSTGQCVIDSIAVQHGESGYFLDLEFHCYANICHPTSEKEDETDSKKEQEQIMDIATEIVCDTTEYSGEWTGSDYWCFSSGEITLNVPITQTEYDAGAVEDNLATLAERCLDAINNDPERRCRAFEEFAAGLNEQMNDLGNDARAGKLREEAA